MTLRILRCGADKLRCGARKIRLYTKKIDVKKVIKRCFLVKNAYLRYLFKSSKNPSFNKAWGPKVYIYIGMAPKVGEKGVQLRS